MKWILSVFVLGFILLATKVTYAQDHLDPQLYKKSYAHWQKQKEKHKNSYVLTLSNGSVFGWYSRTIIVVKEGAVVKRSYSEGHISPPQDWQASEWEEVGKQLGEHKEGYPLVTLDDIYAYAEGYLPNPVKISFQAENGEEERTITPNIEVYFSTEHKGLVSTIGYRHKYCMDDCFRGYQIDNIEWAK